MKIGGKPSGPPLDLTLSLRIACLTNTEENMTLFKHVLVKDGVEKTGICSISVVNIDAKLVCNNSALRVESINIGPSLHLRGSIRLLLVNLRLV